MFEPDILDLIEFLAHAGRTVETHLWHGQVHAFPVLDTLLPENRETMRLTAVFLRNALRDQPTRRRIRPDAATKVEPQADRLG